MAQAALTLLAGLVIWLLLIVLRYLRDLIPWAISEAP
jgi:hypothetical protein